MKKFILAAMVAFALTTTASAQQAAQPAAPKNYVGLSAAVVTTDNDSTVNSYGVRLGREFSNLLVGELAFDHTRAAGAVDSGNTLFANALVQYRIPNTVFTPYVLVGLGYGNDRWGDRALYNFGVGVRAEVSRTTDFDLRFRQVRNFEDMHNNINDQTYVNVVSAGLNFKF